MYDPPPPGALTLLIEQAGVVFGIRLGTLTTDQTESPIYTSPDEKTNEQRIFPARHRRRKNRQRQ